ncbi:Serine/threonine-protein kinase PknD [Streptomyces tendae]
MRELGDGDPQHIGAYRPPGRLGGAAWATSIWPFGPRAHGRREAAARGTRPLEQFRERFRQEVESARRVGVLDCARTGRRHRGRRAVGGHRIRRGAQPPAGRRARPRRAAGTLGPPLGAGLAHALQDIHAAGIIHRDLKPSNVLVTIDGPRVIDFGIARALETVADGGLTRTGALVGSPGFMAPEQVRGDRVTPACDVFCLGSVLAYAATGRLPFGAANSGVHALMFRIAQEAPDLEGVPEGIADLVRDCLKKDPAARPGLAEVLERTGAQDTVTGGRSRDPWLPSALVAQLGRHAVRLLDTENPQTPARRGARRRPVARCPVVRWWGLVARCPVVRWWGLAARCPVVRWWGPAARGPVVRGPTVRGQVMRGPVVRGPVVRCLPLRVESPGRNPLAWCPVVRGQPAWGRTVWVPVVRALAVRALAVRAPWCGVRWCGVGRCVARWCGVRWPGW